MNGFKTALLLGLLTGLILAIGGVLGGRSGMTIALVLAGVMNLLWVAAIAAFVLVEKLVTRARAVSWSAGAVFLGWGGWMLLRAL